MKTIIIDDELLNIKNLEIILHENFPLICVEATFQSVQHATEYINQNEVDLVFLDIQMPLFDGFDLLAIFPERTFQVIFVTAHEEFAIKALRAGATDYILKPILFSELNIAIDKAFTKFKQKKTYNPNGKIVLNYSDGKAIFDPEELIYIQGIDNVSKVFLTFERRIIIAKTLKYFEEILDERFFRVHKSFLINLEFCESIISEEQYFVKLKNKVKIPISRRNYKPLNDKFSK
jgi:two-component system LytT family response regulator